MSTPQVLIVGAGPSGMVLALELAKVGVPFRIIDKNSGPGLQSRAMAVQARTLEFYRQLGFANQVVEHGIEIESLTIYVNGEHKAEIDIKDFGEDLSPFPFILSYPQDEHEKLLVNELKKLGVEIEWNTELEHFVDRGNEIHAIIRNGERSEDIRVPYMVGCDGAHSKVREGLNISFDGGTYDKTFFVADVDAIGAAARPKSFNFCIRQNDFVLVLPIRTTGMVRLIGLIPDQFAANEKLTYSHLEGYVHDTTGLRVDTVNWFSTYRVHHRVTSRFKVDNVFICGDASHIHSPVGGQGMNTGIGDAVNLGWKLAAVIQGRANSSILDTYEPERIAFAHALLETTDKVFQLMTGDGVGNQFFRETIFPHLVPYALGFGAIKSSAFKLISQTKISYHDSDLSVGEAGDYKAGDRLPWVPLVDGSDNFDPLQTLDWQIHVYGEVSPGLREIGLKTGIFVRGFEWIDPMEDVGLQRDAIYLVRPDGYIAFADPAQNIDALQDYIAKFFIIPRKAAIDEKPAAEPIQTAVPQQRPW